MILRILGIGLSYNTKGVKMSERIPRPKAYFPLTLVLLIIGTGGLIYLMLTTEPTLGPRWMFFFFVMFLGTGFALPVAILINHRFPSSPPAGEKIIFREALLFGSFATLLAWLSHGRLLTGGLVGIIFVGFAAIEVFTRLWERGRGRE